MRTIKIRAIPFIYLLMLVAAIFPSLHSQAQSKEEASRDVCRAKLIEARKKHHTIPTSKPEFQNHAANELGNRMLGVTLWRLSPSHRSLNHPVQIGEFIPESINLDTPLKDHDKVRISVELPRDGYLYVVDSEQYDDGERNAALIFPTGRINGGNNRIGPGISVGLPNLNDNPPYFELSVKDHQVAENLRIIVTDAPIPGLVIGNDPIRLTSEQFDEWHKWEVQTKQVPLEKVGKLQSKAELKAEIS